MHAQSNAVLLQDEEALLPIHGNEHLLQVDEEPVERGQLNVGKLLSQLCLDHRVTCPLPVTAAM
jgi:hypothetical protein